MSKHSKHSNKKQLTKDVDQVLDKLVKPDKPVTDKPVTDKPVTDKPVTDKPVTDKPVTDKPVTDKPIIEKRIIKSNGEPDITVNEDSNGNLVLTPDDKVSLDNVKTLQATAIQAKIDAKEAINKAKEAIQALNGSEAIKAIKQDIETRLKTQEAITSKALTVYQEAKEKLNDIQSEYQALTGITKKSKASIGKTKISNGNGNGNGKFETKPITIDSDGALKILVTHKETQNLFEYSLYPANGTIAKSDWLKLRHSLTAQFERETNEDNLTIRAYLSNLKTKIEAIKAIA